ncbi:MAG: calcium-binding protein [Chloroflexi bacterium]|nr:MAG: calcium-binding protein [Chloroflexota bacterium]
MKKGYALLVILFLTTIILSSACIQKTTTIDGQERTSTLTTSSSLTSTTNPEDNDGLSFDEEQKYGTDPYDPDTDDDGIIDGDEVHKYGTNPLKVDSDEDGITDYEELFEYGTNPLDVDTDGDGLYDDVEVLKGTDPTLEDTDGDNIVDADEVNIYFTNPLLQDTDGDGLTDYAEIFTYNTSPTTEDSDEDGINDSAELELKTNPMLEDTDNDGLQDGEELVKYHTDPLNPDSDDDGLLDGQEVVEFGTNPLEADSDKDYLPDGYEVRIGTSPTHDWRLYYGPEAFKAGLSKLLRKEISPIAKQFVAYNTTLDRTWAILEWIDENIQYNHTKADLVDKLVYNWSTLSEYERELYDNLTKLQAANDTIYHKSGICGDYAILTAALLLESNISPVYMLDIDYKDKEIGHASVATKIDGEYFVLDQFLPPMPIGNYYWNSLRGSKMGEIANVTFYAIRLNKNGEPVIYSNWTWTGERIKEKAYSMTEEDIDFIIKLTKQKFLEIYPSYNEDKRLKQNAEEDLESIKSTNETAKTFLPYGFTKGWTLWWYNEYFALYYHPAIAEKLVEHYWPIPAFREDDWREVIKQCDKFYLIMDTDENNGNTIKDSTGDAFKIPRIIMVMEIAK